MQTEKYGSMKWFTPPPPVTSLRIAERFTDSFFGISRLKATTLTSVRPLQTQNINSTSAAMCRARKAQDPRTEANYPHHHFNSRVGIWTYTRIHSSQLHVPRMGRKWSAAPAAKRSRAPKEAPKSPAEKPPPAAQASWSYSYYSIIVGYILGMTAIVIYGLINITEKKMERSI